MFVVRAMLYQGSIGGPAPLLIFRGRSFLVTMSILNLSSFLVGFAFVTASLARVRPNEATTRAFILGTSSVNALIGALTLKLYHSFPKGLSEIQALRLCLIVTLFLLTYYAFIIYGAVLMRRLQVKDESSKLYHLTKEHPGIIDKVYIIITLQILNTLYTTYILALQLTANFLLQLRNHLIQRNATD